MEIKKECLGKVAITIEKDYHNSNRAYDKLVIVEKEGAYKTYISRKAVPADIPITDREYWLPFSSLAEELQLDYNRYKSQLEIELRELKERFDSFSDINKKIIELIQEHIESVGKPNGIAQLDESGKVPAEQLPSYVDDVLEFDTIDDFPEVGESGKIYVDISTSRGYRWSGSTYIFVGNPLELGETSSTAYRGDRGASSYEVTRRIASKGILAGTNAASLISFDKKLNELNLTYPYVRTDSGSGGSRSVKVPLAAYDQTGVISSELFQCIVKLQNSNAIIFLRDGSDNNNFQDDGSKLSTSIRCTNAYIGTKERYFNIPYATTDTAGVMSSADKVKLDNIGDTKLLTDKQKQILDNIDNYGIVFGSQSSNENIFQVFYYSDNLELGIYGYSASNPSTETRINNRVKLPLATEDNPGIISRATAKHIEATKSALEQIILTNDESWIDNPDSQCVSYSFNYKTIVNGEIGEETLYIDAPYATTRYAGLISADDKNKLDSIDTQKIEDINNIDTDRLNAVATINSKLGMNTYVGAKNPNVLSGEKIIDVEYTTDGIDLIYKLVDANSDGTVVKRQPISTATNIQHGLMSSEDKTNLETLITKVAQLEAKIAQLEGN